MSAGGPLFDALAAGRGISKSDCNGCEDDFYNGRNPYGVQECWSFKSAQMVTLYQIGKWTPMDRKENFRKVRKPNCYRQKGSCFLKQLPEHLR